MGQRLTLGYREATAASAGPCFEVGERFRGHEFHYSAIEPGTSESPAWRLAAGGAEWDEGAVQGAVHASYLHMHWAAHPQLARRLVSATRAAAVAR